MALLRAVAIAALLGLSATAAQASPITLDYNFTASGFAFADTPDPITGSFSITFDNSIDITDQQGSLFVTLSEPFPSFEVFTYSRPPTH